MTKPLTDEGLAAKIKRDCSSGDIEVDHGNADQLLVIQLKALGYEKAVEAYHAVEKWYA